MTDRVQAYNQASVPWMGSYPDGTTEGHSADLDRRPHRAATSPAPSTSSSHTNPQLGQAAYPSSLYPGNRPPQTIHNSDLYFSPRMNYTRYDPLYPPNPAPQDPAQLYPAHQQQYHGASNYYPNQQIRSHSPVPPVPVPPKPPGLQQDVRHDGRHGPLHPAMYRSFTSPPPVPPKPSLLFEPEAAAIPTSAYLGSSSSAVTPSTTATTTPPIPQLSSAASKSETPAWEVPPTQPQEDAGEGDDLAVALALSKDESLREEERMNELSRLEEEEFERALAASMLTANSVHEFYDSQSGAGPSNWASSMTQSSPASAPIYLLQEADPSASTASSSSAEGQLQDDAQKPLSQSKPLGPADESKLGEPASQARTTESVVQTARTSSPQQIKRRSLDITLPNGTDPHDHEDDPLPRYSSDIATGSSIPVSNISPEYGTTKSGAPKEGEGGEDYDSDELPYLRGTRQHLSVSIPAAGTSTTSKRMLSPVSASFIDLSYDDSYIDEDEALARKLAEEEAEAARQESQQRSQQTNPAPPEGHVSRNTSTSSTITTNSVIGSDLPTYSDAVSIMSSSRKSTFVSEVGSATSSRRSTFVPEVRIDMPQRNEKTDLARNYSVNSVASDPMANASSLPNAHSFIDGPTAIALRPDDSHRIIGRVSSMSALPAPSRSPIESDDPPPLSDDELATPINRASLNPKAIHLTAASANGTNSNDTSSSSSSLGILNANHFVDADLLHGVSINFTPPVVSAKLTSMQGQLPTLISLPYGRCPSLHFQAPGWRHALKLMARLSGTKIEPSIEALAVTRNETLKLRTVIQFIKPHHMSYEWRTILWFTLDHPVPPNTPNSQKYHTTNVNILPFSYTLSTVPAILRDAADTVLSKTYTIPATASVPYPLLPITFPNLALYLQAALDDSRRQSDSSPLSKLAKMVQTCYPNDLLLNDADEPERSGGVSGLFKKVIGRGGKKGKKGGGGGNEDTYDLVTPFVPDEWG